MTMELTRNTVIRKLLPGEEFLFAQHLLRLDAESRRLRFTHSVTDEYIRNYAARSLAPGSIVYALLCEGVIRAAAELKLSGPGWSGAAEAAFSVEGHFANRGYATELMGRIIRSARNRGVRHLVMTCLAENAKMQAIARKHDAHLQFVEGDIIADIVPFRPDYLSFATEAFEDRLTIWLAAIDRYSRAVRRAA